MRGTRGSAFLHGLVLGVAGSACCALFTLYLLLYLGMWDPAQLGIAGILPATDWLQRNLGLSLLPFLITLVLYTVTLHRLAQRVEAGLPVEQVAQLEHLADIWISLFFGIGVIWTAIGMRAALLYALGDLEVSGNRDAFSVLERLVDGGILTALSTTILGGAGGYLMRLAKIFLVGERLKHYYHTRETSRSDRIEDLLGDIRDQGLPRKVTTLASREPRS